MRTKIFPLTVLIMGIGLSSLVYGPSPQTRPEYIPLGGGVKGVLYRPDSNPITQCRRHYHSPHSELFTTCRMYATVATGTDGALHDFTLRQ